MLGRVRRTSRLDVGLALTCSGLAYLVWALVAGGSRKLVQLLIRSTAATGMELPAFTRHVKVFFVDTGFIIDVVGLCWLAVSLTLVLLASRQRISASWAWVSAIGQVTVAALGSVLVGGAVYAPHAIAARGVEAEHTPWETVSSISLPVIVPLAILLWVTCLIWLLVERARLDRRGPTLTDGLRTNIYK